MRVVSSEEKRQRGCEYCLHHKKRSGCSFNECPYHELDDVKTYGEYLEKTGYIFGNLIVDPFDIYEDYHG